MGYPQAAPVAPAPSNDPFATPAGGGGNNPSPRHLLGRTVIIVPNRIDDTNEYAGARRPQVWCRLIVVEPGVIEYGNNVVTGTPNTHYVNGPVYFDNAVINSGPIVDACRPYVGVGNIPARPVIGVIERGTKGEKGNPPYLLVDPAKTLDGKERPDGTQRREAARQLWMAIEAGQFVNPTPQLLAVMPVQQPQYAPAQVTYQQPAQPAQQYQQYAPQAPAQPAYAQVAQNDGPPPGWDAAMWAGFSPEQRAAILAQQPGAAPVSAPGHPGI